MQGSRPSKRITCLGPLMVMESGRTFCVRGWSFPGRLVVLRELQSSHISTHLQGALCGWVGEAQGPCCPSPMGVALGGGALGRSRHRRASLSPSFYLSLGSASPCSWLSWKRDVSVCLSGSPSSDHLASTTPTPTVLFFFLERLAPVRGEARPQHTVAQCLRPQASRPALYNAFVVCFFLPWTGGACVRVWVIFV